MGLHVKKARQISEFCKSTNFYEIQSTSRNSAGRILVSAGFFYLLPPPRLALAYPDSVSASDSELGRLLSYIS
jgi:hypothetical protein